MTALDDVASVASPTPSVDVALERGRDALLAMQDQRGWWKGILDTNVTMDAEDLMLRHVLGVLRTDQATATAAWIRSQQRTDGTWATFHGGPGDLSTTIEAYVALRLAGDPAEAAHLRAAAAFVRAEGGLPHSRVFTRLWMALCNAWSWDELPALTPEVMLLPSWLPLNIYDFACWARQTIVPLTVVAAHRLARPLPFAIDELYTASHSTGSSPALSTASSVASWRTTEGRLALLDRALRRYDRHCLRPLRRRALARAEQWIIARQEADGSWGGIQPPWVYSILALHVLGYPLDHPIMRAAFDGLDRFTVLEGATRRLEACQSPVWDTALALIALRDSGCRPDDPALVRGAEWLLGQEIRRRGDWSVRRPKLAPGGWAFEFENDNYPDIDDTAEVVLALLASTGDTGPDALDGAHKIAPRAEAAIERAVAWVLGMQCRDGGWAAFDVDNTRDLCRKLPFCDFGAVIDPPSADVTAHVIEMLAHVRPHPNTEVHDAPLQAGIDWLWRAQELDGSWFGRWGANHVYGTGHVLPALVAAGVRGDDCRIVRAVQWLRDCQNVDGGWGEDLRSYRDPTRRGQGASTASQTAWALCGLLAAGPRDDVVERGVRYLAATQRTDGTWDEPLYTGTGFPGDFYINYHLYRQVFPLMALGRYAHGTSSHG